VSTDHFDLPAFQNNLRHDSNKKWLLFVLDLSERREIAIHNRIATKDNIIAANEAQIPVLLQLLLLLILLVILL
jgi:hypothetical protein